MIVMTGTLTGAYKLSIINERANKLRLIISMIARINILTEYTSAPIHEILMANKNEFPEFLNEYIKNKENNLKHNAAWEKSVYSIKNLNADDKKQLIDYGKTLGSTGVTGQISNNSLFTKLFEERLEKAQRQRLEKGKLYVPLGTLIGASAALIIL
jgi:stage III sporulation protein AB